MKPSHERVEADYAGQTTANGGAIISTRDSARWASASSRSPTRRPGRGRKTLRAVIKGGRRSDRVIVRFTRGKANVRVVVPVGKTVRTKTR